MISWNFKYIRNGKITEESMKACSKEEAHAKINEYLKTLRRKYKRKMELISIDPPCESDEDTTETPVITENLRETFIVYIYTKGGQEGYFANIVTPISPIKSRVDIETLQQAIEIAEEKENVIVLNWRYL